MVLLVETQLAAVEELLVAARNRAGQLGVAVLCPLVVRKLELPSCLEVAARHITPGDQAPVHGPHVPTETRVRQELQVTAGLWAGQLGVSMLRPAVARQLVLLCSRVIAAWLVALDDEPLMNSLLVQPETSG